MTKLIYQIVKFGGVGILCFIIDFSVLYLLTDILKIPVLISSGLAFTVSVVANYLLSVRFVFDVNQEKSKTRNFILFVVFSVIGLILTEIIMSIGVHTLHFNYLAVKIISTAIVMVFNFVTRKMFLE